MTLLHELSGSQREHEPMCVGGSCQRRPPPRMLEPMERPALVWLTPFVRGPQKTSSKVVVSSGLRAGWEIPVKLGEGQTESLLQKSPF